MEITKINTNFSCNYLVKKGDKRILIDCSCEMEDLIKLTDKLDAIVITHGHFDHFFTLEQVQKHYGCKVFMHEKAFEKLTNSRQNASRFFGMIFECKIDKKNVEFLREGQNDIGGVMCNIYYAFGHTNDSVLIEIDKALFTGDFLFKNSYGRTDLPTGNFITMQQNLQKYRPLISSHICYYGH